MDLGYHEHEGRDLLEDFVYKDWEELYQRAKEPDNPLDLSSSEYRNLTKKLTKRIFEEGRKSGMAEAKSEPGKADFAAAAARIEEHTSSLKPGSERHKGVQKALEALRDPEA